MIFHYHDSPMTEKLDYFSASSLVLYNLYYILIRVVELNYARFLRMRGNQSLSSFKEGMLNNFRSVVGAIFTSFYLYHIHYLNYVKFDYGYNMKVNIIAG